MLHPALSFPQVEDAFGISAKQARRPNKNSLNELKRRTPIRREPKPHSTDHMPYLPIRWWPIVALMVFLTCTGCQNLRPPFYPLGIYSVPGLKDLPAVRRAGFNLVTGPAERSFLDAAQTVNLKVLASLPTAAGPQFNALAVRRTVAALDFHPALWGWYLIDEPDVTKVSPEAVRAAQRFMKFIPAKKPTALVIYQGATAIDYANIADITMIDRYPIPWLPLANVPQHVRLVRLALGKKKPLIAVIQAFDWSAYREELPGEKNLRPPTYDELRCMTYCALAQRATGLFYYCFASGAWRITEHPEVWEALKKVVREVNERSPLFQAEHLWWPVSHQFGDPTIRFNAALDSSITSVLLRVKRGNAAVPPGDYILTVNNTDKPHGYSFSLPKGGSVNGIIPVLGEDRFVAFLDQWVTDSFEPYAVHVYGPLPGVP